MQNLCDGEEGNLISDTLRDIVNEKVLTVDEKLSLNRVSDLDLELD